ncbi:MAG: PEP-CTERM sorting domain-containing protein [Gammaproteobacteria bacterium]
MRKLLIGAALLISLSPLQAAEQTFEWSFKNFGDYWGYDIISETTISGTFAVDDLNGDGKFEQSELKLFEYQGYDLTTCSGCTISRFSFDPAGALDFGIRRDVSYEYGRSITVVDVGAYYANVFFPYSGEPGEFGGRWVDQTVATVTAVPEPHTYMMLGAGLLALAGAARRRKQ